MRQQAPTDHCQTPWSGELAMLAISRTVQVIPPPMGATRFPLAVHGAASGELVGTIDELWIDVVGEGEAASVRGRGRVAGELGRQIRDGVSAPVRLALRRDGRVLTDGWAVSSLLVWTTPPGSGARLTGALALDHDPGYPTAFRLQTGAIGTYPRALASVPTPEPAEDLRGWIERLARHLGCTTRHAMDMAGLEPGSDAERRIRALSSRVTERSARRFIAATGLDAEDLKQLQRASRDLVRIERSATPATALRARAALFEHVREAMADSCPQDAGGYGGRLGICHERLSPEAADLVRAAMRAGARQLGWKAETYCLLTRRGYQVGIRDMRPVPAEFAATVEEARYAMAAADARHARSVSGRGGRGSTEEAGTREGGSLSESVTSMAKRALEPSP